MLIAALSSKWQ